MKNLEKIATRLALIDTVGVAVLVVVFVFTLNLFL
jgi:hypothetical protein